jgi:peptide/nickel transport system substrate-binding protein
MDLKKVKNVVAQGYPNHGFYTLSYNTRRPPLDDPAFRRAIDHVIPRDLMIEAILSGFGEPGGSVMLRPTSSGTIRRSRRILKISTSQKKS